MISNDALQNGFLSHPLFINDRERNDELFKNRYVFVFFVVVFIFILLNNKNFNELEGCARSGFF